MKTKSVMHPLSRPFAEQMLVSGGAAMSDRLRLGHRWVTVPSLLSPALREDQMCLRWYPHSTAFAEPHRDHKLWALSGRLPGGDPYFLARMPA